MKVLITGAGGFIGSHLVECFAKEGYQVKALVRYNSRNSWGWLENIEFLDRVEIVTGDVRDYDSVCRAMKGCSAVLHLAALIGIPYSYISPLAYIKTNIEGTYNILEAARVLEVPHILITSTSETYGTAQYAPIDEQHPSVGQSPYSASKIAADQLALSYHFSFGQSVKIVRPFNTYGPRQSARAVIPTIISQILSGRTTIDLGNVDPTRDLTYVTDTANGFLKIFQSDALIGQATNIGMNEEISIGDLAKLIGSLMGVDIRIVADPNRVRPEKSEVDRLHCDNAKLLNNTSWRPIFNLEKGLIETINWIKGNMAYYKAGVYNV
jgi:dTDP-glucose 4,6-dehydratase